MLKSDSIELALDTYEDAVATAEILLRNNYVVMLSREAEMYIVNAVFAAYGDRHDTVFMSRDYFDDTYMPITVEEAPNAES